MARAGRATDRPSRRLIAALAGSAMAVIAGCSGSSVETITTGERSTTTVAVDRTATTAGGSASGGATPSTTKAPTATKTPTTRVAPLPDPCVIVDKEAAEVLAATALQDGVKAGPADDIGCTYAGDPSGPIAQVEIFIGPGAKKFYEIDVDLKHEFTAVPGIGDEAHLEDFVIFFRKGSTWVAIRMVRLDDFAAYRTPMLDLAKQVAAKLP